MGISNTVKEEAIRLTFTQIITVDFVVQAEVSSHFTDESSCGIKGVRSVMVGRVGPGVVGRVGCDGCY